MFEGEWIQQADNAIDVGIGKYDSVWVLGTYGIPSLLTIQRRLYFKSATAEQINTDSEVAGDDYSAHNPIKRVSAYNSNRNASPFTC